MRGLPLLLSFQKLHKYILLMGLLLGVFANVAGQKLIVVDSNNSPLEGVSIIDANQRFGGITDEQGVLLLDQQVRFPITMQYLGYKTISLSQKQLIGNNWQAVMKASNLIIEEIVLIGRTDIAKEDLAYASTRIDIADIQLSNSQTTADALSSTGEVYVQKSQMGGGSPVVRGFEANKLLLVIDGVRMNNAIYRSGHLQNAITIDPAILANVDVIFGPGSLMFGSDALGGVLHFESKKLDIDSHMAGDFQGSYYTRYGSSNNEKSAHLDVAYYGKKWASLSSATMVDYDDLRIGENRNSKYPESYGLRNSFVLTDFENANDSIIFGDPNVLRYTGYSQYDFLQKFSFEPTDQWTFLWNTQFSTSSNVPRYDALTESSNGLPRYSSWNYGPQKRLLSSLTTEFTPRSSMVYDKVKVILAYQQVNEIRLTRNFGEFVEQEQNERLNIVNTTIDFSRLRGANQWFFGLDGNFNSLTSTAFNRFYNNGIFNRIEEGLTRYPNGQNTTFSSGAYIQYYHTPAGKNYKLNAGLRYDFNYLYTQFVEDDVFQWPAYFYDGIETMNQAINWSTGIHWKLPYNFKLRILAGSSFRAPNIDDLSKIRLNNNEISIPNTELIPERSLNGEITFAYQNKKLEISATGFYTYLSDAIVRADFLLPNGHSEFISQNDTFNIVANQNAENALVSGVSISADLQLNTWMHLEGSMSLTKGDIISDGAATEPLAHVPPTYGRLFLGYDREKIQWQSGVRFNSFKSIDRFGGTTDNPEFATSRGSESWYTLHATISYAWYDSFQIQLGIDNILDQFYVPFASGLPGAGRHISLTLRGDF